MSVVLRISLVILAVCGGALFFVTRAQVETTARRYREATEEPLVDVAMMLAAIVAESSPGELSPAIVKEAVSRAKSSKLEATIYDLSRSDFDLRVYVTDGSGRAVFDSEDSEAAGRDYSNWNDVYRTLRGEYGARSTRVVGANGASHSVLYVSAPIVREGRLLGALTVGKPTKSADLFAKGARMGTVVLGVTAFGVCALVALLLAYAVSRPILKLTAYARDVRDGRRANIPKLPAGEIRRLGTAFEEMREALDGRRYIEQYVQTLAHALKSPLSGIRGAAELLREDLPLEDRARFISNISADATRMQQLLDKLLALSTLQKEKTLTSAEPIEISEALKEAVGAVERQATARGVRMALQEEASARILGNKLWLGEALANLLVNAIEFSPRNSTIEVTVARSAQNWEIRIRDHGPGLPEWADGRVFERFYSLPRPDTGMKSTGLGLSIVREVASLHAGTAELRNHPSGGAEAILTFPASM